MRILLIEDDRMVGEAIVEMLRDAAYATDWVREGSAAIHALATHSYDILLLDLGLPDLDGLQVMQQLRQKDRDLPVIIISARDGVEHRVKGLDSGADDYLLKPFDSSELLARIRAVSRRKGSANITLGNGDLTLDPVSYCASRYGRSFQLSAREYSLLRALLTRPGSILSRSELEERIYGWGEEVESNAVEFLIYSLRKKLGKDAIHNVRGLGWMVSKVQ